MEYLCDMLELLDQIGIEIKLNNPATKARVAVLETNFLYFSSNIEFLLSFINQIQVNPDSGTNI